MKAFSVFILSAGVAARSIPSQTTHIDEALEESKLVARQWNQAPQAPQQSGWFQYVAPNQQQSQGWAQPQQEAASSLAYSLFTPNLGPQPSQQGGWGSNSIAPQPTPSKISTAAPSASSTPGILESVAGGAIGLVSLPFNVVTGFGSWLFGNGTSTAAPAKSPVLSSGRSSSLPLPQSNNGWGQPAIQQGGWGIAEQAPSPTPTPTPTSSGGWFGNLFGGNKAATPSATPTPSPTPLAPAQSAALESDEETSVPGVPGVPKYIQCAGNTINGGCPYDNVCLADPRSRGVVLDSICVPTQIRCGGKKYDICPTNMICVSDPRTPTWYV
jgi:hypothetical protein